MKAYLGSQLIQKEVRRTWVFSISCLIGVLLLFATGIYPAFVKGRQVEQEISQLNEEREIQMRLQPFLISLMTIENAIKCSPDLVYVNKKPLARERLLNFDKRIIAMASEFEMQAVSVDVNVDEIKRGDLVLVDACLIGDFKNFRRFLLHLGQISWVQNLETIEVGGYRNQEQLNVAFKLALE